MDVIRSKLPLARWLTEGRIWVAFSQSRKRVGELAPYIVSVRMAHENAARAGFNDPFDASMQVDQVKRAGIAREPRAASRSDITHGCEVIAFDLVVVREKHDTL